MRSVCRLDDQGLVSNFDRHQQAPTNYCKGHASYDEHESRKANRQDDRPGQGRLLFRFTQGEKQSH
jgi:hypothetical protein